jgi:ribonuclease P/MRP protein subunit POP1
MQSAAVQAEAAAAQAAGIPITPSGSAPPSAKPALAPVTGPPQGQYTTATATWDNGKITLRGNPFKTLKENYCPSCKLPRLMFPLAGLGMRIPEDISRQYCTLHPFIRRPGYDIYGNPFPVDAGKTKKEREALRKLELERQDKDNTPGSVDTGDAEGGADSAAVRKLMAGGKGASYIPWHTCPNCKRSLLITKFAQHLEKCMGIGGRTARNAAAARLSGINGSANGSTQGSRTGTPTPSQTNGKRIVDDDDDDEPPPKKKTKKEKREKKDKLEKELEKKQKISIKLKIKHGGGGDSSTPKLSKLSSSMDADKASSESSAKREREEGGTDDSPKKKMKMAKDLIRKPEITVGAQ